VSCFIETASSTALLGVLGGRTHQIVTVCGGTRYVSTSGACSRDADVSIVTAVYDNDDDDQPAHCEKAAP